MPKLAIIPPEYIANPAELHDLAAEIRTLVFAVSDAGLRQALREVAVELETAAVGKGQNNKIVQ